jgi:hypothetical protein
MMQNLCKGFGKKLNFFGNMMQDFKIGFIANQRTFLYIFSISFLIMLYFSLRLSAFVIEWSNQ